jgi:hypothetical protein
MSPEAAPSIVADCPTVPVQTSQQVRRQLTMTRSSAGVTALTQPGGAGREAFPDGLKNSEMGSTFARYEMSAFGNLDSLPSAAPAQYLEPLSATCQPAFPRTSD